MLPCTCHGTTGGSFYSIKIFSVEVDHRHASASQVNSRLSMDHRPWDIPSLFRDAVAIDTETMGLTVHGHGFFAQIVNGYHGWHWVEMVCHRYRDIYLIDIIDTIMHCIDMVLTMKMIIVLKSKLYFLPHSLH